MKKKMNRGVWIMRIVVMTFVLLSFSGCSQEEMLNKNIERLEEKILNLKSQIVSLEQERDAIQGEIVDVKIENGTAKYILTINISQRHFSFNFEDHLKDAMNDIDIQIPVDREYFESVEVGDTISDEFRVGSFICKGSFGSWDITVKDKQIH